MSISLLLEMAVSGNPDRTAVVSGDVRLTTQRAERPRRRRRGRHRGVGLPSTSSTSVPAARCCRCCCSPRRAPAVAFTPINYRLSADGLQALIDRLPDPAGDRRRPVPRHGRLGTARQVMDSDEFLAAARTAEPAAEFPDPDAVGVVLFTSGTTSQPKAVELSHNNLTSYVTGTVEFAVGRTRRRRADLRAAVPHRRRQRGAVESVRRPKDGVPAELRRRRMGAAGRRRGRHHGDGGADHARPHRHGAGGRRRRSCRRCATWPTADRRSGLPLVRKALELLPDVGFVNAYGLTETSSTIAVLTPDDHRDRPRRRRRRDRRAGWVRSASRCPASRCRSATRTATFCGPGETGELFVRGEQVSGRYTGIGSVLDDEGWFPTKDIAMLDDERLPVHRRPHPTTPSSAAARTSRPPRSRTCSSSTPMCTTSPWSAPRIREWGQAIVAVVVPVAGIDPDPDELREHVRSALRGSRTPDRVVFRDELPTNATGKVLRREIVASLACDAAPATTSQRNEHEGQSHDQERHPPAEPGVRHPGDRGQTADSLDDLRCGGAPMVALDAEKTPAEIDPKFADGNVMGKRYVDEAGAEVLVTKAGQGTLSVGESPLSLKEAKPLPASD